MADAKYKIIEKEEQDINTEQEEDDDDDDEDEEYEYTGNFDDDDTVTIITSSNHESHSIYSNKTNDEDIMRTPAAILALILVYYAFSIGLTFYQRKLLKDFHFPFSVVLYHLLLKLVISALIRVMYKCITGRSRVHVEFKKSFKKLAPTGVVAGIDIGFSNWGLELVTISLYTMTKSTTIIFICFFAILFGLEKKSWSLMAIVVLISSGLCMFTYKSTQFNALGFCFILIASISSGIRWTFAQYIMQKSKLGLHNPIDMIYFMQPWMILPILPLALGFEGYAFYEFFDTVSDTGLSSDKLYFIITSTAGAFLAFAMEISEFLLLSYTSSLTLSIAGIFKEIFLLILAVKLNGDQMTTLNMLGLAVCMSGISLHVFHKFFINKPATNNKIPNISDATLMISSKPYDYHQAMSMNAANVTSNKQNIRLNYFSAQKTPLLYSTDDALHSDSDDTQNNDQNASEVIFDVLKRRDARR